MRWRPNVRKFREAAAGFLLGFGPRWHVNELPAVCAFRDYPPDVQPMPIGHDGDPAKTLKEGAKILQCDLDELKNTSRVSETEKTDRDLTLYLL